MPPLTTVWASDEDLAIEAPADFRWRAEPYEFVADPPAIDLLTGSEAARRGLEAGATVDELASGFVEFERAFAERRGPCLLPEYAGT